jgi:hypothetical protein
MFFCPAYAPGGSSFTLWCEASTPQAGLLVIRLAAHHRLSSIRSFHSFTIRPFVARSAFVNQDMAAVDGSIAATVIEDIVVSSTIGWEDMLHRRRAA